MKMKLILIATSILSFSGIAQAENCASKCETKTAAECKTECDTTVAAKAEECATACESKVMVKAEKCESECASKTMVKAEKCETECASKTVAAKEKCESECSSVNVAHYTVTGMTCGGCSKKLTSALAAVKGVEVKKVCHKSGHVDVVLGEGATSKQVEEVITQKGFKIAPAKEVKKG